MCVSFKYYICYTAVALAFEEMRTPYASEREICVQKFRNAYQRNRKTNGAFEKHLYHHASNDSAKYWNVVRKRCALPFHNTRVASVIVCLMCSLRRVETESRFLRTSYASLPWLCVQLHFYAYYAEICVNATADCKYACRTWWTAVINKQLPDTILFYILLCIFSVSMWS